MCTRFWSGVDDMKKLSKLSLASLVILVTFLQHIPTVFTYGSTYVPLKWLLIYDANLYGDNKGTTWFWINVLRNWGIPFDIIKDSNVNDNTFWNSTNQKPKYQTFVYGAIDRVSTHVAKRAANSAMQKAIYNGTNGILAGAGLKGQESLFGIGSIADTSSTVTTTFYVSTQFTTPDDRTRTVGTSKTTTTTIRSIRINKWNGTGTMYLKTTSNQLTGNNASAIRRTYGQGVVWWLPLMLGPWTGSDSKGYMAAWETDNLNYYSDFELLRDIVQTALNDVWRYKVQIMPWGRRGSAQVVRMDDASVWSLVFTERQLNSWINQGRQAVFLVMMGGGMLPGVSNKAIRLTTTDAAWTNLPGEKGYRYVPAGVTSFDLNNYKNVKFVLYAEYTNTTQTVSDDLVTIDLGGSETQTFMTDANATILAQLRVKINSTSSAQYRLWVLRANGSSVWTSGIQTAPVVTTWVTLKPNRTISALTTYIIKLNGTSANVALWVKSGDPYVGGQLGSDANKDASFVVGTRGYWDLLKFDTDNDGDMGDEKELAGEDFRMANGQLYPNQNGSVQLTAASAPDSKKWWGFSYVLGRTNTGAPTLNGNPIFGWWTTVSQWNTDPYSVKTKMLNLTKYGYEIVFHCHAHHNYEGKSSKSTDFWWPLNGTAYSYSQIVTKQNMINSMADQVFGAGKYSKIQTWAFSTASFPRDAIYNAGQQKGAFSDAGVWLAPGGTSQLYPNSMGVTIGGFTRTYAGSPWEMASVRTWASSVPVKYEGINATRLAHAVVEYKNDPNNNELNNIYDYLNKKGALLDYNTYSMAYMNYSRAFSFWNSTYHMLTNMTRAFYQDGKIYLDFDAENNVPGKVEKLVWRFPKINPFGDGKDYTSATANQTGWIITNQTNTLIHFETSVATGKTRITVEYGVSLNNASTIGQFSVPSLMDNSILWPSHNTNSIQSYVRDYTIA